MLSLSACTELITPPHTSPVSPDFDLSAPMMVAENSKDMSFKADEALGDEVIADSSPEEKRQLAYEYSATVRLPVGAVADMVRHHEKACSEVGPNICQLVLSSMVEHDLNEIGATLNIRAQKEWMTEFREKLVEDVRGAQGRVHAFTAQVEDISRAITDTNARLLAQQALRDRLVEVLDSDTHQIGDLLKVEQELSRVQGEVESIESYLRVLSGRVAMDHITLYYETLPQVVSTRATQPLYDAVNKLVSIFSQSVALLILFVAGALPWVVVGLPSLWGLLSVLRWITRGRGRSSPKSTEDNKNTPRTYEELGSEPSVE